MGALVASLLLALAGAHAVPVDTAPGAIERVSFPGVLVTVRTLAIDGLDGLAIDENALLLHSVDLAWDDEQIPPGWVAPRPRLVARPVPLWQLGGPDRDGRVFHGSALSALLAGLETALREQGIADARVRLDAKALSRLSTPGSDGLLMLRVRR